MKQYIQLGSTPWEEKCPQIGYDDQFVKPVARIYKEQLLRIAEKAGLDVELKIHENEAAAIIEDTGTDDSEDWDQAIALEGMTPANWDEQAKADLIRIGWAKKTEVIQFGSE